MKLFRRNQRYHTEESEALYARYEIARTIVDFGAALCFIVGSVLFFFEWSQVPATWLFLIGSVLFAAKPSIKLAREIKLYRLGEVSDLADKLRD